jgi:hypothetical protein
VRCGDCLRLQIRDVPGPQTVSFSDFVQYADRVTTIVFILDVTVRCLSTADQVKRIAIAFVD